VKKTGMAALSARMGVAAMALTGIGLALPRMGQELGFTEAQLGLLVSVQYAGFTVAVIAGGALSDRYGAGRMLRIGLLGAAAAAGLFGFVWAYWAAVAAALLIGAFGSVMENSVTALAMAGEEHRDRNNILVQVAFSAGAIVLPLLYWISLSCFGAWRPPYWILGLLALAFCAFTPGGKAEDQGRAAPSGPMLAQYLAFFRRPAFLIAPAAMFLYVGAEIGLWAFAPVFFENSGYGVFSGAIASALIWFFMMLGRLITARIVEKLGIMRTMVLFGVLACASLALMMVSSGAWAVACTAAAGFACAPFFPLIMSWMTRITGSGSGSSIAFTMAAGTLGPVVLGGVTGIIGERFGTQWVMMVPLMCFVGIFILLALFGKSGENTKREAGRA
jgi:fucose permease